MKQKWIKKDGDKFERIAENPVDDDKTNLGNFIGEPSLDKHEKKMVDQYKKRKHLNVKSINSIAYPRILHQGEEIHLQIQ